MFCILNCFLLVYSDFTSELTHLQYPPVRAHTATPAAIVQDNNIVHDKHVHTDTCSHSHSHSHGHQHAHNGETNKSK